MNELRTMEEIKQRINKISEFDILGISADLIVYLPYEDAKEFLKPEITEKEYEEKYRKKYTKDTIVKEIKDYMLFALGKAENHRGISASRSIEHMCAWLFLLKDDKLLEFAEDDDNYKNYGCPILKKICDKYGIEYPNDEHMLNMADGKKCYEECDGCGR